MPVTRIIIVDDEKPIRRVIEAALNKANREVKTFSSGTLALEEVETDLPMVARLVGTNEEEGRAILAQAEMITAATLEEAAQKAVAAASTYGERT